MEKMDKVFARSTFGTTKHKKTKSKRNEISCSSPEPAAARRGALRCAAPPDRRSPWSSPALNRVVPPAARQLRRPRRCTQLPTARRSGKARRSKHQRSPTSGCGWGSPQLAVDRDCSQIGKLAQRLLSCQKSKGGRKKDAECKDREDGWERGRQ
jgi:hypothetical protein